MENIADFLEANHYLGAATRGIGWSDAHGVLVLANPSSRRLPQHKWFELTRWCLERQKNGGSRQWRAVAAWVKRRFPEVTTVVSYSDPSVGHTGALYRACNWLWAPTWHRLRPPPSGNGDWGTGQQAVKDRWIYCLRPDPSRPALLALNDESIRKRMPWAEYREGAGGDFKRWRAVV